MSIFFSSSLYFLKFFSFYTNFFCFSYLLCKYIKCVLYFGTIKIFPDHLYLSEPFCDPLVYNCSFIHNYIYSFICNFICKCFIIQCFKNSFIHSSQWKQIDYKLKLCPSVVKMNINSLRFIHLTNIGLYIFQNIICIIYLFTIYKKQFSSVTFTQIFITSRQRNRAISLVHGRTREFSL